MQILRNGGTCHWYLDVYDVVNNTYFVHDSLGSKSNKVHYLTEIDRSHRLLLLRLTPAWAAGDGTRGVPDLPKDLPLPTVVLLGPSLIGQQTAGTLHCGPWAIHYGTCLLTGHSVPALARVGSAFETLLRQQCSVLLYRNGPTLSLVRASPGVAAGAANHCCWCPPDAYASVGCQADHSHLVTLDLSARYTTSCPPPMLPCAAALSQAVPVSHIDELHVQ